MHDDESESVDHPSRTDAMFVSELPHRARVVYFTSPEPVITYFSVNLSTVDEFGTFNNADKLLLRVALHVN